MSYPTRAVFGIGRLGATPLGYGADRLLCQVGPRLSAARVGYARLGATAVGLTSTVEHLRHVRWGDGQEFQLTDAGNGQPMTCDLEFVSADYRDRPSSGDLVIVAVGTLKNRLFAGRIDDFDEEEFGPRYRYLCQASGFLTRLKGLYVFEHYQHQTSGDILQLLFAAYAPDPEFVLFLPYIEDGILLDDIRFEGVSLLDACNDLAARNDYQFFVDALRRVHFAPAASLTAPWNVTSTERYADLKVKADSSELCTQVIIRHSRLDTRTQTFLGDGVTEQFPLSEPVESVISLTVDGAAVSYGSRYREDNSSNDFAVHEGEKYVVNSAYPTLTAGQRLQIIYRAKIAMRLTVTDTLAVAARRAIEGGSGIYACVLEDREIVTITDALLMAASYLQRYSSPYYEAAYTRLESLSSYSRLALRPGMTQAVTARGYALSLLIKQVTLRVIKPDSGLGVLLEQNVALGDRRYALADIFKQIQTAPEIVNEETGAINI